MVGSLAQRTTPELEVPGADFSLPTHRRLLRRPLGWTFSGTALRIVVSHNGKVSARGRRGLMIRAENREEEKVEEK